MIYIACALTVLTLSFTAKLVQLSVTDYDERENLGSALIGYGFGLLINTSLLWGTVEMWRFAL